MRVLIMAVSVLVCASAAAASLRPGSRAELALPSFWDEDTKSVETPGFITVAQAGSIETCTFTGGPVTVKKVENGQVFFDPSPAPKGGRCAHLVTSAETFASWDPAAVRRQKA